MDAKKELGELSRAISPDLQSSCSLGQAAFFSSK